MALRVLDELSAMYYASPSKRLEEELQMERLWFEPVDLAKINAFNDRDMISRLGLVYTDVGDDRLEARFEIDERTRQPFGLLHGGVSCAVSESMGSIAANLCVDRERCSCVGIEINASHLRRATAGTVTAHCTPVRVGRATHVWQTDLFDMQGRQLCVSRLTVAVIERHS